MKSTVTAIRWAVHDDVGKRVNRNTTDAAYVWYKVKTEVWANVLRPVDMQVWDHITWGNIL